MSTIKHGDIVPLPLTVADPDTGLPVDLSGATLRVLLRAAYSTGDPEELAIEPGSDLVHGVVSVVFDATSRALGDYWIEVEASQGDIVVTAPTVGYGRITIVADLG